MTHPISLPSFYCMYNVYFLLESVIFFRFLLDRSYWSFLSFSSTKFQKLSRYLWTALPSFFLTRWRCGPARSMGSSLLRFLDHTQRRITYDRTPPNEWSARRRPLYLTTHNTQTRQTSMPPPRDSKSQSRRSAAALDRGHRDRHLVQCSTWESI